MTDETNLIRESAELIHGDGRTVVVQLAKWGEPRTVSDDGRTTYREAFESIDLADRVRVVDQHYGDTIGHADVTSYRADPEPTIDLHIAETSRGDDVLALIRNGTIEGVSVEFRPSKTDRVVDGVMRRANALVHGIAFAFRPAHTAPILATREQPETGETTMTTEATVPAGVTATDLETFGDDLRRDMLEQFNVIRSDTEQPDPYADLRKYRSLAEYAAAAFDDDSLHERSLLNRALTDQITANNPGVVPPAWLSEVQGIIPRMRPACTNFGVSALPAAGVQLDWPAYRGGYPTVTEQAVQNT